MKNNIIKLILGVSIASMLVGCNVSGDLANNAQNNDSNTVIESDIFQNSEKNESKEVSEQSDNNLNQEVVANSESVQNNNSYFVKIGNKIYYRSYPKDSLNKASLGGHFMYDGTGKATDIMCYDIDTKESSVVFSDHGAGKITYANGRLYLFELEQEQDYMVSRGYSCLIDGSDMKKVEGLDNVERLVGYDEATQIFVYETYTEDYDRTVSIVKNNAVENVISQEEHAIDALCLGEGYLVYGSYSSEGESTHIYSKNLANDSTVELGTMPGTAEEGFYDAFINASIENGIIRFAGERVEGSGAFLADGAIFTANVAVEGSLCKERDYTEEEINNEISPLSEKISTSYLAGANYDLEWKENGEFDSVEVSEMSGDYIFYVVNHIVYSEEESVGWRDAYIRTKTNYIMVNKNSGEITYLSEVNCE